MNKIASEVPNGEQKELTVDDLGNFNRLMLSVLAVVAVISLVILGVYFSRFNGELSSQEVFGQFGDFFGGALNPILGFATVILLVSSIRIQMKELRLAREEMKVANREAAKSAEAMTRQMEHMERQDKIQEMYQVLNTFRQQILVISDRKWILDDSLRNKTGLTRLNDGWSLNYLKRVVDRKGDLLDDHRKTIAQLGGAFGYAPYLDFRADIIQSLSRALEVVAQLVSLHVSHYNCEIEAQEIIMLINDLLALGVISDGDAKEALKPLDDAVKVRQEKDLSFPSIKNKYRRD